MIRNLIILLALIGSAAAYTIFSDFSDSPKTSDAKKETSELQQKIPSFEFKSITGEKHSIQEYKDKVVVLNFWASWCAPCVVEFPQMLNLARETQDKSVFVFLSVDDKNQDIDRFLKTHKIKPAPNVIIAWDEDKSISQDLFQTYKLPETYIVSPGLIMREKIIGADLVWDSKDMKEKVETFHKLR